jgi:hypothetical protein
MNFVSLQKLDFFLLEILAKKKKKKKKRISKLKSVKI